MSSKKIGEFYEKLDFSQDPNIFLFYRHILTGLQAFANPQQSADESFAKYKVMLRIAESFLSEKYDIDFNEVRKRIAKETKDESERLSREVMEIAKILDKSIRKVEIQLVWKKGIKEEDDFNSELLELANADLSDTSDT